MSVMALTAQPAHAISCQDLRDVGDVLRYALPLGAYGMTAGYLDGRGAFQFTKTLAFTGIGMGGRAIYGKFDTSKLYNKTEFTDLALQIGRSF